MSPPPSRAGHAGDAGLLVVAAAGNQATDADENPLVPAAFPGNAIVSVAATDPDDGLASTSNWGSDSVDLSAPGTNIVSTTPLDYDASPGHGSLSGTRRRHPVAAAAALVRSANPVRIAFPGPDDAAGHGGPRRRPGGEDGIGRTAGCSGGGCCALDRYDGGLGVDSVSLPRPRRRLRFQSP